MPLALARPLSALAHSHELHALSQLVVVTGSGYLPASQIK